MQNAQHGFVNERSCLDNLLSILNAVFQHVEDGEDVDMCFLDVSKAFYVVNRNFICAKLAAHGISLVMVGSIMSFLANRTFHVCIGNVVSKEAAIPTGVPQGSVI